MHCAADLLSGNYLHCAVDLIHDLRVWVPSIVVVFTFGWAWLRSK